MLSPAFQPRLLDPDESPVLEAREIMTRFPRRWVFVEVTEDYDPREYDGFRGRVLAEAPTRATISPLAQAVFRRWSETGYDCETFAFWTDCTPPKTFRDLSSPDYFDE